MAPFQLLLGSIAGMLSLALPWAYPVSRPLPWLAAALVCWIPWRLIRKRLPGAVPAPDAPAAFLAAFSVGYLWAGWHIGGVLETRLPDCADARSRTFELAVLDDPAYEQGVAWRDGARVSGTRIARFTGGVQVPPDAECAGLGGHRIRFSWYDPPGLRQGQHWRVEGRLRPPWGYANAAGFDYERWLLGQALGGTGYVRSGRLDAASQPGPAATPGLRERLRNAVEARRLDWGPLVIALMIGDDSGISARHWQALRDSGTVHLLVVSGLHVGMIAGLLFQVGRGVSRLSPALLICAGSRRVASVLAAAGSGFYVCLSGFGVPAVRAWIMSAVVLLVLAAGRQVSPMRVLALVLGFTLAANPLVVHQSGFWLSFAAVLSLLFYFEPRVSGPPERGAWRMFGSLRRLITVQGVLFVSLSPLLAADQSGIPLSAPLVNAFAVPLVTLVVLPLILMTGPLLVFFPALSTAIASFLLETVNTLLDWLMTGVAFGAGLPAIAVGVGGRVEWLILATAVFLLGRSPGRVAGLMLAALWWAVLIPDGVPPLPGEVRVTALDVGQGSAIVLETARHRMLYDTGARYPSGFDLGEAVVVPNLRRARMTGLDGLVLSHDDLDHTGGAAAVQRAFTPARVWTSYALPADHWARGRRRRCTAGTSWNWDGVAFEFLHPAESWRGSDNDGSCVLLIEAAGGQALIAGDVSSRVERRLPKRPVDLAFAPHHGSATSSSPGFVRGFRPRVVFISTDRRSRYGHPHPDVLARYRNSRVFITGRNGALRWESAEPARVVPERASSAAYWQRVWVDGNGVAVSRAGAAPYPDDG